MDTMNAIRNRKSFRGPFTDTPVSREDLTELLEAGYLAPSGCNLQTTWLIGVDDPELLAGLADIYSHEWAKGATAAILLIGSYTMSPSGVSYHVHDYCAAAENIYLAAADKGLGTVWIEGQIRGERAEKMGRLLSVPEDQTVYIYMPVGYPAKPGPDAKKKPFEERVWFNGYGGAKSCTSTE